MAFNPFIARLGKRITGYDQATSQILQQNLNGENGPGYVTQIHNKTVSSLAPGLMLESMTNDMLSEASAYFEKLKRGEFLDFFAWTRQMVTMCSTKAIYGPNNPFSQDEEKFVKTFW